MRRTRAPGELKMRRTDWRRATHRMPASFADQPHRDELVQGRRNDDALDLVEAVTGAAAVAAIAQLATGNELVREDAVGVNEEDVVVAADEAGMEEEDEDRDEED